MDNNNRCCGTPLTEKYALFRNNACELYRVLLGKDQKPNFDLYSERRRNPLQAVLGEQLDFFVRDKGVPIVLQSSRCEA